jgi:hypothetical protein
MAKANPKRVAAVRADVERAGFGAVVVTAVVIFHHLVVRSLLAFSPFIWLRWRSIGFTGFAGTVVRGSGGVAMIGAYFGLDVFDLLILKVALVAVVTIVIPFAVVIFPLVVVAVQIAVMFAVHGVVVAFRATLMVFKVPLLVVWVFQQGTALGAEHPASRSAGLANLLPLGFPAFLAIRRMFNELRREASADVMLTWRQAAFALLAGRQPPAEPVAVVVYVLAHHEDDVLVGDPVRHRTRPLGFALFFCLCSAGKDSLGLFPDRPGGFYVTFTSDPCTSMNPRFHTDEPLEFLLLLE